MEDYYVTTMDTNVHRVAANSPEEAEEIIRAGTGGKQVELVMFEVTDVTKVDVEDEMTIKEYKEVKEYIKDNFEQFDGYPVEEETNDGTV